MKNLEALREYLISKGIPPEELDEVKELPIVSDLGNALVVTFENDNQLGELVWSLFSQVNDLATMVLQLQTELDTLKNGGNA
jgi:hypothetical protein